MRDDNDSTVPHNAIDATVWCDKAGFWIAQRFIDDQLCPYWECCGGRPIDALANEQEARGEITTGEKE